MAEEGKLKDSTGFGSFTQAGGFPKVTSIFDFSAEALEQLSLWLEMRGLRTPITQILGFSQFTANAATSITADETTASTSFTNLTTSGPTITGLSDGKYMVVFGGKMRFSSGSGTAYMSVKVNSTEATDADAAEFTDSTGAGLGVPGVRAITATLSNDGNNTLLARYRVTAGTAGFSKRWMVAIRYANA